MSQLNIFTTVQSSAQRTMAFQHRLVFPPFSWFSLHLTTIALLPFSYLVAPLSVRSCPTFGQLAYVYLFSWVVLLLSSTGYNLDSQQSHLKCDQFSVPLMPSSFAFPSSLPPSLSLSPPPSLPPFLSSP